MSKPKTYKTTDAHFKLFKNECEKWVDLFQLRSWGVDYRHEDHDETPESRAWCFTNLRGRVATLGLSVSWGDNKPEVSTVRKSAFHEACELLISRLVAEAEVDTCPTQKSDIEEHKHAIIRRLEHAVFK